jgi:ribosomal subunit interface protein
MTPEISAYLDEKLAAIEKLINVPDEDAVRGDVELANTHTQDGQPWNAEINLYVNGELYRAVAKGESVNAALDAVKDELMSRLRRSKKKRFDMLKRGGARIKQLLKFGRE